MIEGFCYRREADGINGITTAKDKNAGGFAPAFSSLPMVFRLDQGRGVDLVVPGVRCLEGFVDVLDVLDAFGVEPVLEGLRALLRIDGDAVLPGGATAEDAQAGQLFG